MSDEGKESDQKHCILRFYKIKCKLPPVNTVIEILKFLSSYFRKTIVNILRAEFPTFVAMRSIVSLKVLKTIEIVNQCRTLLSKCNRFNHGLRD